MHIGQSKFTSVTTRYGIRECECFSDYIRIWAMQLSRLQVRLADTEREKEKLELRHVPARRFIKTIGDTLCMPPHVRKTLTKRLSPRQFGVATASACILFYKLGVSRSCLLVLCDSIRGAL